MTENLQSDTDNDIITFSAWSLSQSKTTFLNTKKHNAKKCIYGMVQVQVALAITQILCLYWRQKLSFVQNQENLHN